MAVVNPTTKVDLASVDAGDQWDDGDETTTVYATGVPAAIGQPRGQGRQGTQEQVQYQLWCDPQPLLQHHHTVTDQADGAVYQVVWVAQVHGALPHTTAGLNRQTGGAVG